MNAPHSRCMLDLCLLDRLVSRMQSVQLRSVRSMFDPLTSGIDLCDRYTATVDDDWPGNMGLRVTPCRYSDDAPHEVGEYILHDRCLVYP